MAGNLSRGLKFCLSGLYLLPDLVGRDAFAPAANALEPSNRNIKIAALDDFLTDGLGALSGVEAAFQARPRAIGASGLRVYATPVDAIVCLALAAAVPALFVVRVEALIYVVIDRVEQYRSSLKHRYQSLAFFADTSGSGSRATVCVNRISMLALAIISLLDICRTQRCSNNDPDPRRF